MDRFGGSYCNRIWLHDTAVQSFLEPAFVLDHNVLASLRSPAILRCCPQGSKRMEAHLVGYHQSYRVRCSRHGAAAFGLPAYEYRRQKNALGANGKPTTAPKFAKQWHE